MMARASIFLLSALVSAAANREIVTVAGMGQPGYAGDGGPALQAKLNNPFGVVKGPDGAVYICDTGNHVIRRIGTNGIITTVAGTGKKGYGGDGTLATQAELNEPYEIRFDKNGNMYFVEMRNHVLRRVDAETQIISTMAGTGKAGFAGNGEPASTAMFNQPHSIQLDGRGDIFICDIGNHRIRKVDSVAGVISTFGGTGAKGDTKDGAHVARTPLFGPRAIDFDRKGDMWIALREGNAIYRVDTKTSTIKHVAGTGERGITRKLTFGKKATFSGPKGLSVGPDGTVYLADTETHMILAIDPRRETVEPIAGTGERGDGPDGNALKCKMARPHGVFADDDGSIYVGDSEAHRVRLIKPLR